MVLWSRKGNSMGRTTEYREFDMGNSANAYIAKFLDWPRSLSKVLAMTVDVSIGRKMSSLPEGTRLTNIENFAWGGITQKDESVRWFVRKICGYLREDKTKIVLFQHAYSYAKDGWIKECNVPIICFGDEVYFVLLEQDVSDTARLTEVLRHADCPHMIGIMSSLPEDKSIDQGRLDLDTITLLAQRTEHVFVSAFDGEGYIIWTCKERQGT